MKRHFNNRSNREFRHDLFAVGGLFVLWRGYLFILEKIGPAFWLLRGDFLGVITPWANFDGAHYTSIAKDGYGVFQFAFFPVYPQLIRFVEFMTHLPYEFVAVGISHIAFFIGLFLFWRYLKGSRGRVWSIALFLVYPASFFFAAAYSESTYFALAAGTLLFVQKKYWILAGVLAGLASATRLVGVFLWLPIAITMWQQRSHLKSADWLAVFMAPAGLVSYMAYLWKSVGDPLAFFHVQTAFGAGRSGSELIFLPQVLWRYAMIFVTVPSGELLYHVAVFEFTSFVFGVILLIAAWRKRYAPGILPSTQMLRSLERGSIGRRIAKYTNAPTVRSWVLGLLYSVCVLFLPTLTGTLSSMPRYVLAAFPLFAVFGDISSSWVKTAILIVFMILLVYATTGFLRGNFIS